jgi:hypothetical protein
VDPLADKYPGLSSYMYAEGNPVMMVDPNGMATIARRDEWEIDEKTKTVTRVGDKGGKNRQFFTFRSDDKEKESFIDYKKSTFVDGYEKDGYTVVDKSESNRNINKDISNNQNTTYSNVKNESNKSKTDNYVNALDLTSKSLIGLDVRINLYKNTNISLPRLGNGISTGVSIYTTGMSIYDLTKGDQSLINYTDATVGLIGLTETASKYIYGVQYPVVGELVAVYGFARLTFDTFWKFGEKHGARTWIGSNDYKYFE